MKTHIAYWKERLVATFWFTPAVTALGVMALFAVVRIVEGVFPDAALLVHGEKIHGTRLVLSSIATAVMTVVGVLFSVTMLVLQQVSQQYTPRVIENFIRSMTNQVTLGFYIGTFGYALILLRSIQPDPQTGQIEQLGPSVAIVLALVCLGLLIYFIHHLAKSIKSNTILAGIAQQAVAVIDALQQDIDGEAAAQAPIEERELGNVLTLAARSGGYVQEVNWRGFARVLHGVGWSAHLAVTPGDYVYRGDALVRVNTARQLKDEERVKLEGMFTIGLERTHTQDLRFGIRQMVDIALRALSPGVNDPTTAVEAINEIGAVLLCYTERARLPRAVRYADDACLYRKAVGFRELVDLGVNEIAVAGKDFYVIQQAIQRILLRCLRATDDAEKIGVLQHKLEQLRAEIGPVAGANLYR